MNLNDRLKFGHYLTIYNKDYIKKTIPPQGIKYSTPQEFSDPICEGFKNYLDLDATTPPASPREKADTYFDRVKNEKPKIGRMYFESALDRVTIDADKLESGNSVYQVDYCDIEADIRRKLLETSKEHYSLPEGWQIPLTTQKYDYRPPQLLSEHAMDPPYVIKRPNNLGQNEKINAILNVKTEDSEYNHTIGSLGAFIVEEQMHGKLNHPKFRDIM
ncbi:uncharacterized protein LOC143191880 [Rhynchophorus ferrugineus]|uniref:Uncharacterized protein n=1 Tax=Rhynchophorus ferrugineus TaxID=354439 RepID=A0A834MPD9_RHYFE|nr:hypothetical protein GWI33_002039 [Rhynchophorus ferrugineus]